MFNRFLAAFNNNGYQPVPAEAPEASVESASEHDDIFESFVANDVMKMIFAKLPIKDLASAAQVNKRFNRLAQESQTSAVTEVVCHGTDANGQKVKKTRQVELHGTYAAVRKAMIKREQNGEREEELQHHCCNQSNMQSKGCLVYGGFVNTVLSAGCGFVTNATAQSIGVGACGSAGLATGGSFLFFAGGCLAVKAYRNYNKKIRDEIGHLSQDRSKPVYPGVVVMEDGQSTEIVERIRDHAQVYPYYPTHAFGYYG